MSNEIDITPKKKRKPLVVNYGGDKFTLPGRIPPEIITATDSVTRPKVMAGSQEEKYKQNVGVATIAAFLEYVVPEEFRMVLDLEDVEPVFQAWSEHVELGKSKSSDE